MRNFLSENTEIKIITFIMSLLLWFLVTIKGQSDVILEMPVEFKNIPRGMEIVKVSDKFVNVRLAGHEQLVKNLTPKDISVYVDMSKAAEGEKVYYLNKDNVKTPPSVSVVKINPSNVILEVEETISKVVAIKPIIKGAPRKGYKVMEVITVPQEITIEGNKKYLKNVPYIETEPIIIDDSAETVERYVRLVYKNRNLDQRKEMVTVKVIVEPITGE